MLTVACVLSQVPGKESQYNRSHVDRLEKQVREHMIQPFNFVCLDDSSLPGFWAKLDLFDRLDGRVLYLDLDSTIVGNLDDIANFPEPFAAISNFKEIKEEPKARLNSSVMAFDSGVTHHLIDDFTPEVMGRLNGDQDWISKMMPSAVTFPSAWCVSYKVQRYLKFNTIPKDTRVICYHGKPKPWDLPDNDIERFTFV